MNIVNRLVVGSYGMHTADQTAIVAVPIVTALLFDASPEVIGVLVAAQSIAHLVGSIPFGLIVDKLQLKSTALLSTAISFFAFSGIALSVYFESLWAFAVSVLLSSFGIVLFSLVGLSIVPLVAKPEALSKTNARIELPRAIASFAVPLIIGFAAFQDFSRFVFGLAVIFSFVAFLAMTQLPQLPTSSKLQQNSWQLIIEAGRHVYRHDLLRPIAACAVFWNAAFSALLVILIPFAVEMFGSSPSVFGLALASFGGAAILGSWLIGRYSESLPTNFFLLFGPGSSLLGISLLVFAQFLGEPIIPVSFFFLGFGPAMWLITQNSIRQLATPNQMLGRVNSVIQTTIYGVRPLGALIGGFIAGTLSPTVGMGFVIVMFVLSFAAALFSRLRTISTLSDVKSLPQSNKYAASRA